MCNKKISEVILNDYNSLYREKKNGNCEKLNEMGIAILVQNLHICNCAVSTLKYTNDPEIIIEYGNFLTLTQRKICKSMYI